MITGLDPTLGLQLKGGMLQNLPPNASPEDLAAVINQIIDKLNTWNGVIVQQNVTFVAATGSARDTFTVPHNLGFAPVPVAFLNNANISGSGGAAGLTAVNIPLPGWVSIDTNNLLAGAVVFPIWLSYYADTKNLYIDIFNATGKATGSLSVTYYLLRLEANTT